MGSRLFRLALAVAAIGFAACRDGPGGPGGSGPGFVALQPVFSPQIQSGQFALDVDTVGLEVRRHGSGELVIDTLIGFDPDSTSLHLALPILMLQPVESFDVRLTLQDGSLVLFSGTSVVELHQGPPGTNAVDSIHVAYEGPGRNIAQLTIAPSDTVLTLGDSTRFNVLAADSSGAPVPQFFVSWSASDTTAGRLDALGKLRAPRARGVVTVSALTPNGVGAAAHVTFIPRPTEILLAGADSAPAPVGQAVPLVARVVAADGLGVLGLAVHFAAVTPGGAVTDTVVRSDSLGQAATRLVVGDSLRDYVYQASVDTLRPAQRTVRAIAGPPAAVGIEAGNAQVGVVGAELPAALAVKVVDAHGNPVSGQRVNFVVTAGGGSVYGGSSNTSAAGLAYERWTLGTTAGTQRLEARAVDNVTGEPLLFAAFTATAVAGPAKELTFVAQPTGVAAGAALPTVRVAVGDAFGNVVGTATDTVRLSLAGPAGATLTGPTAAVTSEGIASFSGLSVQQAGTGYTLHAAAGALQATSQAFDVTAGAPASVTVSAPVTVLAAIGDQVQLTAVLHDAFGNLVTGQPVAWSSGDTTVASVDGAGRVTARRNGSVRITASAGGGATGFIDLTVRQAVTQLAVTPAADSLTALGETLALAAVARDANGNVVPGAAIAWTSSDANVAGVDQTGLVTAAGNGTATITASASGAAGTATVVVAQRVAGVAVTPAAVSLDAIGATAQLSAAPQDANGHAIAGAAVTWASSNGAVAGVDQTGLVTAAGEGSATITATSGGTSGSAGVTVSVPRPDTLTVEIWVGQGDTKTIQLKSKGDTPVAILSNATFDARTVDPYTVRFEGAAPQTNWSYTNVNGDELEDLQLHFTTHQLQVSVGHVTVTLTGRTYGGVAIRGQADVVVIAHSSAAPVGSVGAVP